MVIELCIYASKLLPPSEIGGVLVIRNCCLLLLGLEGPRECIALNGLSRLATRRELRAARHKVSALCYSRATRAYLIWLSRFCVQGELRSCVES